MKMFVFLAFSTLMLLEAYRFSDETDRQALMEFKSQVSEGGRVVLSSWNNSLHVCNWKGVSCGRRHKRVTSLDLGGLQLGGVISPSIGNLSFLVSLNLSVNSFGGTIPQEVGNLFRLKYLNMRNNFLGGGIPVPLFNCSRLEKLYLYSNHLGGVVPQQVGNLFRLQRLDLSENNLGGGIPIPLFNCSRLEELYLYSNPLEGGVPEQVGNLLRLQSLNLSVNNLEGGIPIPLFNCSRLEKLSLSSNPLGGGVPSELGSLTKLFILQLYKNDLKGRLPASLGNLTSLKKVSFSNNNLEGEIPNDIGRLTHIVFLNLDFNKFSGDFPPSIYNLSSLETIGVNGCGFSGRLKSDFGNLLPNLQEIYMGNNFFTGAIPTTLTNISNLQVLSMAKNNMTGSITPSFGKLSNLQRLFLWDNYLGSHSSGDLDFLGALTNCTQLQTLDVSENRLGGDLPPSIANLSASLIFLGLADNFIFGSISLDIENLISLQTIYLSENLLTGPLPNSIGKLLELGDIHLHSNKFSGGIPSSIGNLSQLVTLYLSNNSFEGAIPPSLGNCSQLLYLLIDQNRLTGIIPREILHISSIFSLTVEHNSLSGSLPEDIGQLKYLVYLYAIDNKLSGKLPEALGNCLAMEHLYLGGNSFVGVIPDIRGLVGLRRVDLSNNNLSGSIPEYIANFSKLEYLNLSFNNFEGRVPTTGIFLNSTIVLLSGNKDLCGGVKELKLRPCTAQSPKETKHSSTLKKVVIWVSVGIAFFLVLFIVFLCWFRKRKNYQANNPAALSTLDVFHEKISYGDLRTATDGFSSSNMVGSGSFGTVYKALLPTENKVVAVKVLNLQRHGAMRSFMAECESLKDIRHRNLVKLLTACASIDFQGNQFRALIYEFMANGSLDTWLHPEEVEETSRPKRTLTLLERLNIAIDVASVLDYLHVHCHEPIAHCDLKPSNVLLDDDLIAHVSDFGLARLLFKFDQESFFNQLSSAGVRGTIGYAAPEYGTGGQPSIHGDVYSFGVLLLEMFTGKRPTDELFEGNCTLRSYTESALPEKVLAIADESILHNGLRVGFRVAECLTMVMEVGLRCCEESPTNRLAASEAAKELISIRERSLLQVRTWPRQDIAVKELEQRKGSKCADPELSLTELAIRSVELRPCSPAGEPPKQPARKEFLQTILALISGRISTEFDRIKSRRIPVEECNSTELSFSSVELKARRKIPIFKTRLNFYFPFILREI